MRKALNENTTVQIAVLAVLALGVGFLLLSNMKGGKSNTASTDATAANTAPGATAAVPGSTPAPAPATGVAPAATAAPVSQPATVAPPEAGPGLPPRVLSAYRSGKTVVLLVVRPGGIDDQLVHSASSQLSGRGDVAFYSTPAKNIARYARITEGVGVSQVPALVVVYPSDRSDGAPKATVSYGFRGGDSILQAVRDAEYNGPSVGYDPG